ncbi:AI-2E family transporter [Massilia sp. YIM B02763]|uniref:AI-2E family transporter n=1 Tax=Massilia sp. YIM B02763 TaxID=3050130 RepID=UPI0025B62BDD|nr:AI-2E family transporter [Massilia sp. YIM B02763]MDN4053276.1 AI-2E family transporter [Massilia sp. YIM B02763]
MERRLGKNYTRYAAVILLGLGCLYVLRPFLAAILFAAAVVISSWPLYQRLLGHMRGHRTVAALTMTLSLTLLVIIPLALVAWNLADNIGHAFDQLRYALSHGELLPPAWVRDIPLVGEQIDLYLRQLVASREQMLELAQRMVEPARRWLLAGGIMLGTGVVQMSLAAFVSFFFYRDGETLMTVIGAAMRRVMNEEAESVTDIVSQTVRGVMYGLLGTALAQALVAALGFALAGVPAVLLLSVLVFVSSLIPVGPPVIWGGASVWLFSQGDTGWGIFMLVWGFFAISGVDNIVRPVLISRGSSLPFLLTLLGVLGGVIAFGFVGLFIGPTLLAVGYSLLSGWTHTKDPIVKQKGGGI